MLPAYRDVSAVHVAGRVSHRRLRTVSSAHSPRLSQRVRPIEQRW